MPGRRRAETTFPRWLPWAVVGAVVLALLAGYLVTRTSSTAQVDNQGLRGDNSQLTQQVDATAGQALRAAAPVLDLCSEQNSAAGKALRADPRNPCGLAAQIKADPIAGPKGPNGQVGAQGRGIVGTSISGGRLTVAYTDGTSADLGVVVGAPGAVGKPGPGITSSVIQDGRLVLTYSDGSTVNAGQVDGGKGLDGRGVAGVGQVDGRLIITLTDGTTTDAGPLPAGPSGARGVQGVGVKSVRAETRNGECVLVFELVDPKDGSTADQTVPVADQVCASPIDPPQEPADPDPGG